MSRQLVVDDLVVSQAVAEKVATKHGVTVDEAEEVIFGARTHIRRARQGLYLLYGQTVAGRYLLVVLALFRRRARLVTARSMTKKEIRFYAAQSKK